MAYNDTLSRKQKKAIAALLSEATVEEAAAVAGISDRTIYRWLQFSDTFRHALAEAEAQAVAAAARSIAAGSFEAVSVLRSVANSPEADNRERIAAANSLLSHTPKLRLLGSLESAIEELQRIKNNDDT